ncbi:MAG: hypothetical protein KDB69_09830 [Acidimicrobiia bacterium]|nr:hypothetical protein [Acidimicrobiia bacterium]
MNRKLMYGVAWLAATMVAVVIASAAVGTVRSESEQPSATSPYFNTSTTVATDQSSTTSTGTPGSTSTTSSTAPSSGSSTSTTVTTLPGSTSSTSVTTTTEASTTTTPTSPKTYTLAGGTVTIAANDPTVTLVGAVPKAGFTVDVEHTGPDEVRVEFESENHESSFRAEWEDGELLIDIDEE